MGFFAQALLLMITKSSKCSMGVLQVVANFVYENRDFSTEKFPSCSNPNEVSKALASSDSWQILMADQQAAILKLEVTQTAAAIPEILVSDEADLSHHG